jgi:hypothetical protein|tara:strand:+ start:712 stop:891 length:180 start_codon:yes stop_codon:yes gene_type:complete
MLTQYRIIGKSIIHDNLPSYEDALYCLDMEKNLRPSEDISIEEVKIPTVKGLGRDPDLH